MSASNPTRMTIHRPGGATRAQGISNALFWIEMLLDGGLDGENTAMRVTMDPATMSHWHTHPRGQLLYILSGHGLVQREGEAEQPVRAGDAIWFAPGEMHRHGAVSDSPVSYVSIQAYENGRAVDWFGERSDP
jgi:quercetin dioxygenase-like cupin family protein